MRKRHTPDDHDEGEIDYSSRGYLKRKREKDEIQNNNQYKNTQTSQIFNKCCIWVDGHTSPQASELEPLIFNNGGLMVTTLQTRVTHIIANALPMSKVKAFNKSKKTRPYLYPSWITESVKCGRRLPEVQHLLKSIQNPSFNPTAWTSFQQASSSSSSSSSSSVLHNPSSSSSSSAHSANPHNPVNNNNPSSSTLNNPDFVRQFFQVSLSLSLSLFHMNISLKHA